MAGTLPPPFASVCRFEVAVQRSRAIVYCFATAVAAIVKLLGALTATWGQMAAFLLLALATTLVFGALFSRGRLKLLGVPLRPLWMAADVAMITAQVYGSGGSQSAWFPWYLANAAAGMWVAGTRGFLLVMGANSLAYVGTVALTEAVSLTTLGMVLGRLLIIYGAGFYGLVGISRLQEKRRIIADLRVRESARANELERLTHEIEEREEKFRTLTDTAASAIFVLQDGALCYVNHAAEEISGHTRDELLQMSFWSLLDPRDREQARREAAAILGGGGDSRRYDLKILRKNGEPRWLEFTAGLIRYGGRPALLGAAFDVTERRRFARALSESQRALTTLLRNLPGMAYRGANDEARTMAFVSEGSRELTGYEPSELIAPARLSYADLIHPDDRASARDAVQAAVAAKRPFSLEYRIRTANGQERWVLETGRGVFAASGALEALEGIGTDITDRKKAEGELARLGMAVEQSGEGIVITDRNGTMLYVNSAFERITGYSREEARGQNTRMLKSGQHDQAFYREMWATISRGEVWSGNFVNRHKDGSLYEVEAVIAPLRDAAGEVVNYVAAKRDVTRERQVEEQLRRAQKMEAVGQLAGGVAHDFNNLLMAIMGSAEILQRRLGAADPGQGEVSSIVGAAARAAELTHGLLAFARRQVLSRVDVDLDVVVGEMLPLLRRVIPENIAIEHVSSREPLAVRADRSQIEQVLMNLCVNARDAMPGGGRLIVECSAATATAGDADEEGRAQASRQAVLTVRDTGTGMDATVLARAFEPFFSTKEQGKGTGLGLAVVYGIVRQHGGRVLVESRPGEGSTFSVRLPRVGGRVEPPVARAQAPAVGGCEQILIVEDEPEVRRILVEVLRGLGYRVRDAGDGVEALEILRNDGAGIDLVISDVVMPRMGGERLYEEAARLPSRPVFLFSTGYAPQPQDGSSALDGAFFITKPYGIEEVSRKVREVLDSRPAGALEMAAAATARDAS